MAIIYVANCKRLHFQYLEDHPTATARLVRPNRDDIIDVGTQKILVYHRWFGTFFPYPLVNIQKNYGKSPFFMGKSTIHGNFQ